MVTNATSTFFFDDILVTKVLEISIKSPPFGALLSSPNSSFELLNIRVICRVSPNMLKLRIKCTRFKNTYSYRTNNNNSDWLKAMRKKKDKMKLRFDQIWC